MLMRLSPAVPASDLPESGASSLAGRNNCHGEPKLYRLEPGLLPAYLTIWVMVNEPTASSTIIARPTTVNRTRSLVK